jgi:protease-4
MAIFSDLLKALFFLLLLLQFAPPILHNLKRQYMTFTEQTTKVGFLPIRGIITGASYYSHYLHKFFKDPEIKAILLQIDSPGGAAGASEAIALEIARYQKEYPKKVVAYSTNICASGAYYVAAATDAIITTPSALVGSIGSCIPYQFKLNEFIEQYKIGYNVIKAGEYKSATDPFAPSTQKEVQMLQDAANDSYNTFVEHVAVRRSLTKESAPKWANGKIFTGKQAFGLGLVDSLGSQTDAIKMIKQLAMIEGEIEWIKPERRTGLWGLLTEPEYLPDTDESLVGSCAQGIIQILKEQLHTSFYAS